MKTKIISTVLFFTLLFSLLSVNCFAINNSDTSYYVLTISDDFSYIPARSKTDTSPIFAKITSLSVNSSVKARVVGGADATGPFYNCTLSNNADAPYVTLYLNTKHSIRSMVRERGYYVARLGFKNNSGSAGEGVNGWWSPDSLNTYTVATMDN